MKTNFTVIFIFILFFCGCKKSTGVDKVEIEYKVEHKLFIENLLELNLELNSDTLETRITNTKVTIDGTEYYQITGANFNDLGLSYLPETISYLDSLTTLDISNNQLLDLPDALCSLDIIDGANFLFNDNHLCEASILPPCILEIINFTEQKCDKAYEEDDYQFIQELITANNIDGSKVNEIYDNVHWTTTENKNEFDQFILRITKIEWNDQNISKIPEQIGFLDSLNWLELENNQIDSIPGTIGSLEKLEYLQIYSNRITNLTPKIGDLHNLIEFHAHDNLIDILAFSFDSLTTLKSFWIQKNKLTSLPQSLCDLIDRGLLPSSDFHYHENNICNPVDACNEEITNQYCDD